MMKKIEFINIAAVLSIAISLLVACSGDNSIQHKKAAKEIKRERLETDKETSDLSPAVLVTDILAWDSAKDYRQFKASAMSRITGCNQRISAFKETVKNRHNKVPFRFRKRIDRLEQRSKDLQQRLDGYKLKDRAQWEDFCKLFNYDLKQLEHSIDKLK